MEWLVLPVVVDRDNTRGGRDVQFVDGRDCGVYPIDFSTQRGEVSGLGRIDLSHQGVPLRIECL
jgi:hypothetical protein